AGAALDPLLGAASDMFPVGRNRPKVSAEPENVERALPSRNSDVIESQPVPRRDSVQEELEFKAQEPTPQPQPERPSSYWDLEDNYKRFGQTSKSLTSGMDDLGDLARIQDNRKGIDDLENLVSGEQQARTDSTISQKAELEEQYSQMEQDYVDNTLRERVNEQEIMGAQSEWDAVKDAKRRYNETYKNMEKCFIHDAYKEEYAGIVPRSMIDSNKNAGSHDIFIAAEALGYPGNHEGALAFAENMRSLFELKNMRMKDVFPEGSTPNELKRVEKDARKAFRESDDAKAFRQYVDSHDANIKREDVAGEL